MKDPEIKVSVIVPCYNVEKYIDKCLESISKQSYQNIEILCINDGSTDKTKSKIEEKANNDHRIRLINKNNGGVSSARNKGIEEAKGSYIMFVDSDDFIDENMIEKMLKAAEKNKSDIVKCNRKDIYIGKNVVVERSPIWNKITVIKSRYYDKYIYPEFFGRSRLCNVFMTLINSDLIKNNNIFFHEDLKVDEDEIFAIDIFSHSSCFTYIPECYYNYVKVQTGLSGSGTNIYERVSSRKKHMKLLEDYSSSWKIEKIDYKLREKKAFIAVYTAMQTASKSKKYTKVEQYQLFKSIVQDEYYFQSIKESKMTIMLFPEKIVCFLVKNKMFRMAFYFSRFTESFKSKFRFIFEKNKKKEGQI